MNTVQQQTAPPPPEAAQGTTSNEVTRVQRPPETVRCSGCGHPMATDQRYCLECGTRRGGPRVDFDEYLGASEQEYQQNVGGLEAIRAIALPTY